MPLKCIRTGVCCVERKGGEVKSEKVRGKTCIPRVEFAACGARQSFEVYSIFKTQTHNSWQIMKQSHWSHTTLPRPSGCVGAVNHPWGLICKTSFTLLHQILPYDWKTCRLLFFHYSPNSLGQVCESEHFPLLPSSCLKYLLSCFPCMWELKCSRKKRFTFLCSFSNKLFCDNS